MQGKNNGERKNRVKKIEDSNCSLLLHFWSTYRSPFSTYYIPLQSSGNQESNSSNHVRFGAEMRKIWPLQDNCIQLKDKFASCKNELQRAKLKPTLRNGNGIQPHSHREAQLAKVILQLANLELNVRKWIPSCEINLRDFRKSPCNVQNLHAN